MLRGKKWLAHAPIAITVLVIAVATIRSVTSLLGHAGAVLDDSYIHFEYARAIAEGHPFRYQAGEPVSTGATSALWPMLLAPFYLIGFHGDSLMWAAWLLSFAALGLLAHEAILMTKPLAGNAAAAGAGAMVLLFSGHIWCAASGMEVVPFAWVMTRTLRKAAEWSEKKSSNEPPNSNRDFWELVILGWASFLFRPEGAIAVVVVALVFAVYSRSAKLAFRARDIAIALAVPVATLFFLRLATGHASTSTASVKLLWGNPYYAGAAFTDALVGNLRVFFGTLLEGQVWSAEFIPAGALPFAVAGLIATALLGQQQKKPVRAALVILFALTMLAPCAYVTFLWNRLRYLWPFATGWLIGLACLARVAGDFLSMLKPSWRIATPLIAGIFAGVFGSKITGVIDDVANSASGIDRQHVLLGKWAKENIPAGARIGVNDTGAIAYFGDHPTFDVVGLTTPGEGKYWVAGAGSRFEHYEKLRETSPERLPSYFIVYPQWMACDAVLGPELFEATVTDATILGGQTMGVYEATYALLGSGELSWTAPMEKYFDDVDVADLESEAAHDYQLLGAHDGEQIVRTSLTPDGRTVADGGRTNRMREKFSASIFGGAHRKVVVRLESEHAAHVTMLVNDREIGSISDLGGGEWEELSFDVPDGVDYGDRAQVELRADNYITTFHYYFFADQSGPRFMPPGTE
jgi:hypothetical protein